MADSQAQQTVDSAAQQPVDSTKQVTSPAPAKIIKPKNQKRSDAAKATALKTKMAREEQKQRLKEAEETIAKYELEKAKQAAADGKASSEKTRLDREAKEAAEKNMLADETPPAKNVLTTTQWLSVISIFISVMGLYYKCEEIKKVFTKNSPQAPPPSPVDAAPQRKGGISPMD